MSLLLLQLAPALRDEDKQNRKITNIMATRSEPRTYFEVIPSEALLHMFRYTIPPCSTEDDDADMDVVPIPPWVVPLAHSTHPLHSASVELLRKWTWSEMELLPSKAVLSLFTVYGPTCSSLTILGGIQYHPACFARVLHSCRHLKRLEVNFEGVSGDFPLRELLLSQSNLKELKLLEPGDHAHIADAVTAFGPGLNRLTISLKLSLGTAITRMFEAAGSTLTTLCIYLSKDNVGTDAYRFDLRTIAGWCPQITSLFFPFRQTVFGVDEQRKALILSYGRQLEYVDGLRSWVNTDQRFLNCFLARCPNVNVEAILDDRNQLRLLRTLGSRVRKLTLRMIDDEDLPGLNSAAALCKNVETLSILTAPRNTAKGPRITRDFFGAPKPKLQYLEVSVLGRVKRQADGAPLIAMNDAAISEAVCAIAANTGALQEMNIWSGRIRRSALKELATANPKLEKIVFRTTSLLYIADIIRSFAVCPLLKSVHVNVSDSDESHKKSLVISQACVRMRHRGVSVTVGKTHYL